MSGTLFTVNLKEALALLAEKERIVVTGPQRSGTRIAARILSKELGLSYVDENEIGVDSISKFVIAMEVINRAVIQCPGLSWFVEEMPDFGIDAVVFMFRPVREIIQSQRRIAWGQEAIEFQKYLDNDLVTEELRGKPISAIKYTCWEQQSKSIFEQGAIPILLNYSSLSDHYFWIHEEERRGFDPLQTSPGPG